MNEEHKFFLMTLCALRFLPEGAEDEKIFPVDKWDFKAEGDGEMFIWGVWREGEVWTVNEFYPESGWGCNTYVESGQAGLDFVEAWLQDMAPEYAQMYFPKTIQ